MQPLVDERLLYERLGARIRELRGSRSQEELANAAGVLRTSITNMEKGRQKPPLHVLYRLCAFLNVEAYELLPTLADVYSQEVIILNFGSGDKAVTPKTAKALEELSSLIGGAEQ